MSDLPAWLVTRRMEVDAALDRYLPVAPACPPRVSEAMRYSLFAGGKRLRPILALAAAEAIAAANHESLDEGRARALPAPAWTTPASTTTRETRPSHRRWSCRPTA